MARVPRERFVPGEPRATRPTTIVRCRSATARPSRSPTSSPIMTEALTAGAVAPRARDRHRLRLPDGGAGGARARGVLDRGDRRAGRRARATRSTRSATATSHVRAGDGHARLARARAVRSHPRRRRAPRQCRRRSSSSWSTAGSWSFRSARRTRSCASCRSTATAIDLLATSPVRFVPMVKVGDARTAGEPLSFASGNARDRPHGSRSLVAAVIHRFEKEARRRRGQRRRQRPTAPRGNVAACAGVRSPRPTAARTPTSRRTMRQRKCDPTMRMRTRSPSSTISRRSTRTFVDFSPGSSAVNDAKFCMPTNGRAASRIRATSSGSLIHQTYGLKNAVLRRAIW